jgi:transcriptional regulator with XRE-family HTH domain
MLITDYPEVPTIQKAWVDPGPARRLRAARQAAGFATALAFVRAFHLNPTTYQHHENGRRTIPIQVAQQYARWLDISLIQLLHGDEAVKPISVPFVGIVGRGGVISPMMATAFAERPSINRSRDNDNDPGPIEDQDRFTLPSFEGMERLVVVGDGMYPRLRHGDNVLFRALTYGKPIDKALHGIECVVERLDGQRLLGVIMIQPDGKVTLLAHAEPPVFDLSIRAASPVELIQPRRVITHL